ncbi:hypothetical protein V6N11_071951 [Hibiscus sabdariffa]|uniref:Reverse transcriptase zinc-binding domain-containing protein n=1 Tax=Hibiscus sabdariffa TaxID=183260 RepID=A0ABR2U1K4_9ROSI
MKPSLAIAVEGIQVWHRDPMHSFLVRLTYFAITNVVSSNNDNISSLIARFTSLPRVRSFLWLVSHDRIMTNHYRTRRHLVDDESCSFCGVKKEDTLHVLRVCPTAFAIWSVVIKLELLGNFYSLSVSEWVAANVHDGCHFSISMQNWRLMFGYLE